MSIQRPTHLDVPLPEGWEAKHAADGPLTWLKDGNETLGVLQASILPFEPDDDLTGTVARLATKLGWGEPSSVRTGHSTYGQYGLATFATTSFADIRVWVLYAEGADTVVFTWLSASAEGPANAEVDGIVNDACVTPGSLEEFIPVVIGGARANIEADGALVPAVILFADATYEVLPLTDSSAAFFDAFIEAIRDATAKTGAHTVALAFETTITRADGGTEDAVRIYVERRDARKELLLRTVDVGGQRTLGPARELPPTSIGGLVGFFDPPDLVKLHAAFPEGAEGPKHGEA